MELLQLQYFLKVAERGNMTEAAKELYISQSSLSRTIARLERDMGVQLFNRVGRQIQLNDYGRLLAQRVRQMFFQLDEAQREIADRTGTAGNDISVAITIPGILTFFMERYVDLMNRLKLSQFFISRADAAQKLMDGQVDFVITSDHIETEHITWEFLFRDSILAMVPDTFPMAASEPLDFARFIGSPIITSPQGIGIRALIEDCFTSVGSKPNVIFEENDPAIIFQLVQRQVGVAFITQHNLVRFLNDNNSGDPPSYPGIAMRIIADDCAYMDVGIAHLKSKYITEADRLFLNSFRSYCSDLDKVMHRGLMEKGQP